MYDRNNKYDFINELFSAAYNKNKILELFRIGVVRKNVFKINLIAGTLE